MTSAVVRLYALVLAVLAFFLAWTVIAAHPWQQRSAAPDPRLAALAAERAALREQSLRVQAIVAQRYAVYAAALKERRRAIALVQRLNARTRLAASVAQAQARAQAAASAQASLPTVVVPRVVSVPAVSVTRSSTHA
jgi:hypothetical protein